MIYGFVGLGNLGARLARRLVEAGFEVRVHDARPEPAERLAELGAHPAPSPSLAATGVDALITCLPNPAASRAAMLEEDAAIRALNPAAAWIEMSTTGVDEIKHLAARAAEHGIDLLECPVSGGLHRADSGEMTVFVGGEARVLDRHRPALQAMCGRIFHMGDIGTASLTKILTNMLCLVDLVAAGEALLLARCGNLDLKQFYEAVTASSGNSREFEDWAPVILNGTYNTGFTLELGLKDLGFVTKLGRALDAPMALTEHVERMFEAARDRYGESAWTPSVVRMMEEARGIDLRAEGFPDVIDSNPAD